MQGGNWKNWKRRWFVLNDRCLYYFQHTAENSPKGIIPLEGVKVRPLPNKNGKDWVFEIFSDSGSEVVKGCKTDSHGAVVQGNHKQYRWDKLPAGFRQQTTCFTASVFLLIQTPF